MYYESGIYHSVAESDWSVKPEWVFLTFYSYRKKSIIRYYVMDGVKKMDKNTGCYKIVGEIVGVKMETLGNLLMVIN